MRANEVWLTSRKLHNLLKIQVWVSMFSPANGRMEYWGKALRAHY